MYFLSKQPKIPANLPLNNPLIPFRIAQAVDSDGKKEGETNSQECMVIIVVYQPAYRVNTCINTSIAC